MTDEREPDSGKPNDAPWWHSQPTQPEVDSVLVEGMRLAGALRDWAVESGAVAAMSDLTQTAASSAATYLGHVAQASSEQEPPRSESDDASRPVVRCTDCPVCQGLDALERNNPQLAQTARSGLAQLNTVITGLLGAAGSGGQANS